MIEHNFNAEPMMYLTSRRVQAELSAAHAISNTLSNNIFIIFKCKQAKSVNCFVEEQDQRYTFH